MALVLQSVLLEYLYQPLHPLFNMLCLPMLVHARQRPHTLLQSAQSLLTVLPIQWMQHFHHQFHLYDGCRVFQIFLLAPDGRPSLAISA